MSALRLEADSPSGQSAGPALVLKTERVDTRRVTGCPRAFVWGSYERRCDRWECPSCGPKKARETGRLLVLDADVDPPRACLTLTTADPDTTTAQFRQGMHSLTKRMRRRYGRFEYYARIEFTTGRGPRSGGLRRMHAHATVKLAADVDLRDAEALIRETWSRSLPGRPWRVELAEVRTRKGLLHYLSLHHAKASQLPPPEWRGMHDRGTRGYFHAPVAELRAEAKAQLWAEALAYSSGLDVQDARLLVDGQRAEWDEQREARRALREMEKPEPWSPPVPLAVLFDDSDIPF